MIKIGSITRAMKSKWKTHKIPRSALLMTRTLKENEYHMTRGESREAIPYARIMHMHPLLSSDCLKYLLAIITSLGRRT
jgi:hypothetical protein